MITRRDPICLPLSGTCQARLVLVLVLVGSEVCAMRCGAEGVETEAREAKKGFGADPQPVPRWEWRKRRKRERE